MKFLTDQDVYGQTVRWLAALGHDVVPVARLGLAQASDSDVLADARIQGRILITRDRDYGSLVFLHGAPSGVIYLRILPSTQGPVHAELERVLSMYTEQELSRAFVVIEAGGHRIRRPEARA